MHLQKAKHPAPKKVFIQTFGCQMNEYDTEKMYEMLAHEDYLPAESSDEADLIILNTCSVRDKAEQKVYSRLGRLRQLKKKKPGLKIGVGGCVAQQEGEAILRRAGNVDLVFGTDNLFDLPRMLRETGDGKRLVSTERMAPKQKVRDFIPEEVFQNRHSAGIKAHLAITKGCNNFCSFCIVPATRGQEVSRNPQNILTEARKLVDGGVREICLLGQNVNSYKAGGVGFVELLRRLDGLNGLERVRFTSPHPKDFNEELADAMRELETVCEQLHLPLQSGSNRVLKRMRRWYTLETYMEKVSMLRKRIPDAALSTDLIVGFPGETVEEFHMTLDALREIRYDLVYSFKYSVRPGTRAAEYTEQLPDVVKAERLKALLDVQESILREKQREMIGGMQEVLVEGTHPREQQNITGRTRGNHPVVVTDYSATKGALLPVRISGYRTYSLEAEAVLQNPTV